MFRCSVLFSLKIQAITFLADDYPMFHHKNKHKNKERRNFYRILNVQPDASLEIIKNNYRTLLQKLRMHPDLGGENWNASIINEAYQTLSNEKKRTEYDETLLKRYDIKLLSRGNIEENVKQKHSIKIKDKHGNKRNFYRMLNIQPDSPQHIIRTSYLTLSKNSNIPQNLLDDAYSILNDPTKRLLYDKLLTDRSHAYALGKLTSNQSQPKLKTISKDLNSLNHHAKRQTVIKPIHDYSNKKYYQPLITQYCAFCKTPHNQSPCEHTAALCIECHSPLFPPSDIFIEQERRDIVRMNKDHDVEYYDFWPGKKFTGTISDISPTGIKLVTSDILMKDQIIKLDGEDFKAVGVVIHNNEDRENTLKKQQISGIQFLTVNFDKRKGQFLSESA